MYADAGVKWATAARLRRARERLAAAELREAGHGAIAAMVPIVCADCGAKFDSKNERRKHMEREHWVRPQPYPGVVLNPIWMRKDNTPYQRGNDNG